MRYYKTVHINLFYKFVQIRRLKKGKNINFIEICQKLFENVSCCLGLLLKSRGVSSAQFVQVGVVTERSLKSPNF